MERFFKYFQETGRSSGPRETTSRRRSSWNGYYSIFQGESGSQEDDAGANDFMDDLPKVDRNIWKRLIACYEAELTVWPPLPWDRRVVNAADDPSVEMSKVLLDPVGEFLCERPCGLQSLYEPLWRNRGRPKKVLIRGDAGFGKSTLCRQILRDWVKENGIFPDFPCGNIFLLYYRLRNLRPNSSLVVELFNFLQDHIDQVVQNTAETRDTLLSYRTNVVLLLDGYHELRHQHQEQIQELVRGNSDSVFRFASVVLTSRNDVEKEFLSSFDHHFLVKGLSRETANVVMRKYYGNSDACVGYLMSKYLETLNRYKMSPLFLLMLCYFHLPAPHVNVESIEQLLHGCVSKVIRCNCYTSKVDTTGEVFQTKLRHLGKVFWKCLLERKFTFRQSEIESLFQGDYNLVMAMGLFRKAASLRTNGTDVFEVILPSFMEILAAQHLEDLWYSMSNCEPFHRFLPQVMEHLHAVEIFIFNESSREVSLKVIGQYGSFCYFVWDIKNDAVVFKTYLNSNSIPRKLGTCKLNLTFSFKLDETYLKDRYRKVLNTIFEGNSLPDLFHFQPSRLKLHFLVNENYNWFPQVASLIDPKRDFDTKSSPFVELRDIASEFEMTFLGEGCTHRNVVLTIRNLVYEHFKMDKETNNATDLLKELKKYDNSSSAFLCNIAAVAKLGEYYKLDTNRKRAFEDQRSWFNRQLLFQPDYSWSSIDLFVLSFQHRTFNSNKINHQ